MNETVPFDGEGKKVTATFVPITDYKLREDEESIKMNASIATRTDGDKLRLWGLDLVNNEIVNGAIDITGYAGSEKSPVSLRIYTASRDTNKEVANLTEALKELSVEETEGGNSANTFSDLEHQCDIGAIENLETVKCASDQHRIAAHFGAGDATVAISSLVDYDAANFRIADSDLQDAECNITDVSFARHMNIGGDGPQYREHPNCSGGLRFDTGDSLANYLARKGPPPSMSYGFDEISDILRGAAGEKRYLIPRGYHTDDKSEQPFMDGKINNSILYAMLHYNALYSQYLGSEPMQDRETFHDLSLTNGSNGGGSRMIYKYQNEVRKLCFYSSCPETAAANNIIGGLVNELKPVTMPEHHHTIGCGDVNSSTFARANLTNIRKWLKDNFGKQPGIPQDNPLFWLIAEGIFVSIAMRLRGLLKVHTNTTRLSHLKKETSLLIDRRAGEAAIGAAEVLYNKPNFMSEISMWHSRTLGIDIAVFDEEAQREKFKVCW